jgi:hypothetical protein
MCGSTVALLVAMSAIGCAMGGPNETHWEDAPNIGGDGLTAMLHAVRKRQAETKPETTPMTEPDGGGSGRKSTKLHNTMINFFSGSKERIHGLCAGSHGAARTRRKEASLGHRGRRRNCVSRLYSQTIWVIIFLPLEHSTRT